MNYQHQSGRDITARDVEMADLRRKAKRELPARLHMCEAARSGFVDGLYVERCACGGTRLNGGPWINKNQTRNLARDLPETHALPAKPGLIARFLRAIGLGR